MASLDIEFSYRLRVFFTAVRPTATSSLVSSAPNCSLSNLFSRVDRAAAYRESECPARAWIGYGPVHNDSRARAASIYRYGRRRPDVELNSDGRPRFGRAAAHNADVRRHGRRPLRGRYCVIRRQFCRRYTAVPGRGPGRREVVAPFNRINFNFDDAVCTHASASASASTKTLAVLAL